ncbi:hypothetical protein EPR50_G00203010 [Perca flavescens]|uniref:5'-nucleotidase n=2 Tax=Perca flavescens TaxID=8167 RepID=A0A484C9H3_PERFV|nr:cytosolic 5'-nucleotidase 1A-like isoform X1 [Perca flavescens]TDG98652.1 hypothetical protein EPR50_G00203010 [Perca flavescens]
MNPNNSQTRTANGQDLASSSNQTPGEDARAVLKPSTLVRNLKPPKPENAITIGVSARVLFNMEKEQQIYEQQGMEEYIKYQVEHETQPFSPGPAFSFVKALEAVNTRLRELYPESEELFDVVLMTNNQEYIDQRLINTINHHQLRFCMTGGNHTYHTNLYLSADPVKVREALEEGIAAATMFTPEKITEVSETPLRVTFDGDGVLFSDEAENLFNEEGLEKFLENEKTHANKPLGHGPLKGFLEALGKLQKKFYGKGQRMDCPIRTYLVTARDEDISGIRAKNTLQSWGLEIDETYFLAGAPKGPILEKIRAHIFFDDKMSYVEEAAKMGIVACHVPYGKANRESQERD